MIKVVVVGFGFMGKTHAGNILKNPEVKLAGIVDMNRDNVLNSLKQESGNFSTDTFREEELSKINIYSDLEECIKAENPHACIVAVHTNLHIPMATTALKLGCHVFIEKPFCLDVSGGEQLISLAAKRDKILMIGHVVRFMPAYLTLKKWIDTREYGKLEFLSLFRFSGVPAWGQWKDKQRNFGSSGGALFDLAIHDIDFAQWVCGIPDEVMSNTLPGRLSDYDYLSTLWKYGNKNLHVKIESGNAFHASFPFRASFSARFETASVAYSSSDPAYIIVANDSQVKQVPAGDANDGFSEELNYFFSCIAKNESPLLCTPQSALESVKLCYRQIQ